MKIWPPYFSILSKMTLPAIFPGRRVQLKMTAPLYSTNHNITTKKTNNLEVEIFCDTTFKHEPSREGGGGHFNFICTGVCGHRIGKLTHPQTKAGQKTDPFSDYLQ